MMNLQLWKLEELPSPQIQEPTIAEIQFTYSIETLPTGHAYMAVKPTHIKEFLLAGKEYFV